jgi:hypothetical protein
MQKSRNKFESPPPAYQVERDRNVAAIAETFKDLFGETTPAKCVCLMNWGIDFLFWM